MEIEAFGVREAGELGAALEAIRASRAGALLVDDDPLLLAARGRIVAFAARHRLLAVYEIREFVDAGGLISYGPSVADIHRRAAGCLQKVTARDLICHYAVPLRLLRSPRPLGAPRSRSA